MASDDAIGIAIFAGMAIAVYVALGAMDRRHKPPAASEPAEPPPPPQEGEL